MPTPPGPDVVVNAIPLTAYNFSLFGDVAENPRPEIHPSNFRPDLPFGAVSANQGSAIKYQHVTRMVNLYDQAPSGKLGLATVNMFVCAARVPPEGGLFHVGLLERHPFTTQTFIPLCRRPSTRYLVIVAPTLPPDSLDHGSPVPVPGSGVSVKLPGRGLPDLGRLKAFIATAAQAVTYGAGTWHAPMVALGDMETAVDFVVVQHANGVAIEDCQEVDLSPASAASAASVFADSLRSSCPRRLMVEIPRIGELAKL